MHTTLERMIHRALEDSAKTSVTVDELADLIGLPERLELALTNLGWRRFENGIWRQVE